MSRVHVRLLDERELRGAFKKANLPVRCLFVEDEKRSSEERWTSVSYGPPDDTRVKFIRIIWSSEPSSKNLANLERLLRERVGPKAQLNIEQMPGNFLTFNKVDAPGPQEFQNQINYGLLYPLLKAPSDLEIDLYGECDSVALPLVSKLVEELSKQPAVSELENRLIFANSISCPQLTFEKIARTLLNESAKKGQKSAVLHLRKLIEKNEVSCLEVLYLSGIKVADRVSFGDGVSLLPVAQEDDETRNRKLWGHRSNFPYSEISAALTATVNLPKFASPTHPELPAEVLETHSLLKEIASVLVLAGSGPAVADHLLSIGPEWVIGPQSGIVPLGVDPLGSVRHEQFLPAHPSEIRSIVSKFVGCPADFRKRLRVSLSRLNMAYRRRNPVDTALDLGIALESILASDRENRSDPIGHLVRVRGALFLGKNLEEKNAISDLLRCLYDLRSRAAHDGTLDDETKFSGAKIFTSYLLQDGLSLCSRLLAKLIENGRFPEWKRLELGGKPFQ